METSIGKLIQTHLGIYRLENWTISICSRQLIKKNGIYCVKNLINGKILIGEGTIGRRINAHIRGDSNNIAWKKDLKKYGTDNFRLIWIIEEEDENQRKLIENKLQKHFKDNCYNRPRREYLTQKELLNHQTKYKNQYGYQNIIKRLNNYTPIQKVEGFDECWESKCSLRNKKRHTYPCVKYSGKSYFHHVLMYILYKGDICGITSTVDHLCNNKKCVNPDHLKVVTHTENLRRYHNSNITKEKIEELAKEGYSNSEIAKMADVSMKTCRKYNKVEKTSKFYGVCFFKKIKCYIGQGQYQDFKDSHIHLGCYELEIHAAQNRDFFVWKNNYLDKATLNFHDMDYSKFKPYPMIGGKINKYL